jgi:Ca2+-transporting ATPase
MMADWHLQETEALADELDTDLEKGLTSSEAGSRLERHGSNELVEKGVKSPWMILWEQLTGIMVLILVISAVVSLILAEYTDATVILIIVVLNALLGFTQEYRAEQAMAALKKLAVPHVKVRRDGRTQEISARELVPGDVVLLEAGNAVPADGRVVESVNMRVQESILTGESEPVDKTAKPLAQKDPPIAERRNMVFMGTVITYGRGTMVVTETGMRTQLGKIADLVQSVGQEATPLQRRLEQLGKGLALAALGIVAVVFLLGVVRGEPLRLMFLTAISMAVAAVPEGLPAVVTIALALGAQRMLKRRALIRKLPAVETLGSVTVICSDKTGTLTENRMTVTVLDVAGNRLDLQPLMRDFSPTVRPGDAQAPMLLENSGNALLLLGGALCNDATLEPVEDQEGAYSAVGDPTEGALVISAAQAGLWKDKLTERLRRIAEVPFDSERKRMTTLHSLPEDRRIPGVRLPEGAGKYIVFSKGAVDSLLEISERVWVSGKSEDLTEEWRQRIQGANDDLASKGMRVLGVGFKIVESNPEPGTGSPHPDPLPEGEGVKGEGEEAEEVGAGEAAISLESGLVFVGMFGMIDPARPEVKEAVKTTQEAGIRPIMITGDHPLTALYIAQELGITRHSHVLTGQDLAGMTIEQLREEVKEASVFARVAPEHKLKIVQALRDQGHVVAMTGDGVNDAPALKKADIGVAMGITGTDVSKEASDMVLLDDNFATIVAAVEEGRRIYDNIRKFIKYTMTSNAGEIWVMLLAPFLGMPIPLLPLQILWINLVTDGLPGLALSLEQAEADTMKRPPRPPQESIFGRGMARDILWIGLLMGLVSLLAGIIPWRAGNPAWQTIIFTTLTLAQLGNALATRSERDSLFKIGLLSNRAMLTSVLLTLALQLGVIYLPLLQRIFRTQGLSAAELLFSLVLSTAVFGGVELFKWMLRRRGR